MNGDVDVLAQQMNFMNFSVVNGGDVGGGQQYSPSNQQQLPSENGYGMVQNGQQQTGPRQVILGKHEGHYHLLILIVYSGGTEYEEILKIFNISIFS